MNTVNIVLIEDDWSYARLIKESIEKSSDSTKYTVHDLIHPHGYGFDVQWRGETSLEETCEDIKKLLGDRGILLLDHNLGDWNRKDFSGKDIYQKLPGVTIINISSVPKQDLWGKYFCTYKGYLDDPKSGEFHREQLMKAIKQVLQENGVEID